MGGRRRKGDGRRKQGGRGGHSKDETFRKERGSNVHLKKQSHTYPIPGLNNLGNTCFFNAILQNLSQTHLLRQRMSEYLSLESYTLSIPSGQADVECLQVVVKKEEGAKFDCIARDFHQFLVDMNGMAAKVLNPRVIFNHVCKNAPRFNSYQQQDSHELLVYLLDALKNEEITRRKRAILRSYGVYDKPDTRVMKEGLTDEQKKAIKRYGIQAAMIDTYVDDVFGGKLASSVICQSCNTCTNLREDILNLSLPIPSDKIVNRHPKFKRRPTRYSSDEDEGLGQGATTMTSRRKEPQSNKSLSKHQLRKMEKDKRKKDKAKKSKPVLSLDELSRHVEEKLPSNLQQDITKSPSQEEPRKDISIANGDGEHLSEQKQDSVLPAIMNADEGLADQMEQSLTLEENTHSNPSHLGCDFDQSVANPSTTAEHDPDLTSASRSSSGLSKDNNSDNITGATEGQSTDKIADKQVTCDLTEETSASAIKPGVITREFCQENRENDPFSLESCLRVFSSPEYLKGSERFCCQVCTERARTKKGEEQLHKGKNQTDCDAVSDSIQKQEANEDTQDITDETSGGESLVSTRTKGNKKVFRKSSSSSSGCERDKEKDTESTKESDDEEETVRSDINPAESSETIVLCEATKQLLIDKAPPILCIQLKRFTQFGKNLRSLQKNNVHIDFDMLLDIAPYCTENCQEFCDSKGRFMYSLYGVVVHGGSMHGGHYTAYVRVRTAPSVDDSSETKCGSVSACVSDIEPVNVLDANTECENDTEDKEEQVRLKPLSSSFDYSSIEHSQWYYISDTHVAKASQDDVLQSQAYLLFYEQLPFL